jgi:hypothetical protein
VIADVARQVAKAQTGSEWQIIVTDQHGDIVHTGTTRRRPTVSQKRRILANYPTCVFRDAVCRLPNATSTTPHPGLTAEKPVSKTMHPSADTTMSAVTRRDGST